MGPYMYDSVVAMWLFGGSIEGSLRCHLCHAGIGKSTSTRDDVVVSRVAQLHALDVHVAFFFNF